MALPKASGAQQTNTECAEHATRACNNTIDFHTYVCSFVCMYVYVNTMR